MGSFRLCQVLQKGEEERVEKYGVLLSQYSEVHSKVIPIINKCLEGMKTSSQIVNGPKVCMTGQRDEMHLLPHSLSIRLYKA